MGQGSSKRRFSVKNKNAETGAQEGTNGRREGAQDGSNGRREGGQDASSTSPASPSSPSPSNISGKKEKRKKFSLGLSLRRSPSGRWSRKKRSSALNGARPVSCPDPNDGSLDEPTGRPQSLFLDPVDIQEDHTNEIDTVDLSDTEDQKSTPKSPEKNKLKKDLKSPSKKKNGKLSPKKEKQSPKKDKLSPKRSKQSPKRDKSQKQKAEDTQEARTDETESNQFDRPAPDDSPGPGVQSPILASPSEGQQEADPLEIIAASIVAETVKNAQERLRSDTPKDLTNEPLEENTYESIDIQKNGKVSPNRVLEPPDSQQSNLTHSVSEVKHTDEEPASKMAEEIMYEVMNKPEASSTEPLTQISSETKGRELVQSQAKSCGSLSLEVREVAIRNRDLIQDKTSEPTCHKERLSESDQSKRMEANPPAGDEAACLDTTESSETIEEIVAKQIVQTVLAAALDVVGRDSHSQDTVHKNPGNPGLHTGGLEQESTRERQLEKNEKNVKGTTEHESTRESNEKNVENDEALPREKEKSKNKVSKKFTQWFHKKEKQPKIANEKVSKSIELPKSQSGECSEESSLPNPQEARAGSLTADSLASVEFSPAAQESFVATTNVDVHESSISQHIQTTQSQFLGESTKPSSSTNHTSSTSDTDETSPVPPGKKSEGGFLKKISLGPRLKTAVLRKKSSSAADSKEKHSVAAAASSQGSDVLTAPPRKSRHRNKEDTTKKSKKEDAKLSLTSTEKDTSFSAGQQAKEARDSPKTPDNSSPQMSDSTESKLALTLKSESSETNLTVSDSGVADLTSPELADLPSPEADDTLTSLVDTSPAQTEANHGSPPDDQNVIRSSLDCRDRLLASNTGNNVAAIHQSVQATGVTQLIETEAITQSFDTEAIHKSVDGEVLTQSCSSHLSDYGRADGGVISGLGTVKHSVDKTPVAGGAVETRVECQDWIHSSPLSSPTLVSIASITLRSTSFEGSPARAVPTSSAENSTDFKMTPGFLDSNTLGENVQGSPFDRQNIQEPNLTACDAEVVLEGVPVTSKRSSLSLREVILEANVSASSESGPVPAPSMEGCLVSKTRIQREASPQDKAENLLGCTTHSIVSEHQKKQQSLPEATKRVRTVAEYVIGISTTELGDGRETNDGTSLDE